MFRTERLKRAAGAALVILSAGGCSAVVDRATSGLGDSLSAGILNQADPEIVKAGAPSYLLLVDGLIHKNPSNVSLLLAGSQLYGAYSGTFVDDEARAQAMAQMALEYARRAVCELEKALCASLGAPHEEYIAALNKTRASSAEAIYGLGQAWGGWVQLNSGDWNAIAQIPHIQSTIERVVVLDPATQDGWPYVYLGLLASLRPAAYGGQPEQGREHFETAIRLSEGRNLMAKVLYAKHYARLVFDQELHDRLLGEVLAAEVIAPNLTLSNVVAQEEAAILLAESGDYF